MADGRGRRPGTGDGAGEGEHYDWLYDSTGKPQQPPSEPEHTRVLPTFDRPGRATSGTGSDSARWSAGTTGRATGRGPSGGSGGTPPAPRDRRRLRLPGRPRPLRLALLVVLAYLTYLIAVPVYAWSTVGHANADPKADRPGEQPGTTYLVVGSDARAGLGGRRTDTIMLLHTGDGPNVLMSLPRDSLVEVPGYGVTKINAAFAYGGPRLLVRTIEDATGIRIDDYVEIGFPGFRNLVDAVGGITICPETAMKDKLARLDVKAGCQEADGATALGYARSRHTQSLGDIDRARHQREVVAALGAKIVSWKTVVNPVRYWKVVTAGASSVRVSDGTGPFTAASFAYGMTKVDGKAGLTCGVPIADLAVNWDAERADALFKLIREDRTSRIGKDLCRPSGLPGK